MKTIRDNPQYVEALKTRDALASALGAAKVEEARLLAALDAPPAPKLLETALNLLANKPAVRTDLTGLNRSLGVVRENIETLSLGLAEQNSLVASLTNELSGQASADAAAEHGEAAQGIADALQQLKAAMAKEAEIRGAVSAAGYRCTLPVLVMPVLAMNDPQTPVASFMRQCQNVATDAADAASGAIDKPATVHMLVQYPPHECGDIVVLPGRDARAFVRTGRAEFSTAKPRQARHAAEPCEKVWE